MIILTRKPPLSRIAGVWLLLPFLIVGVYGRITLESVQNLTEVTRECTGSVGDLGGSEGWEGAGGGQIVLDGGDGNGDGDEIEDTITAALHMLCSDLLMELEKPLLSSHIAPEDTLTQLNCSNVKKDFDEFLKETTWFLYEIQERQMEWRWGGGSAVKGGLEWLQGLWASRRANSQDRSFIEQQMELYRDTKCFAKLNREVLRKDIEVVEYLNDLIDMFW
ncbi:d7d8fa3d-c86e-4c0d-b15c-aa7deaf3af8d [Sclerotinia trifoliorum]|uniref:D7d8fa3d-c86e-4c0d-b15c-aa7deaf3af8d n=1 Tax=Sclerotinia trifoliorum TaxID=28548 RepID=A0A8H2ZKH9_9HELO|nr:d7d8fa3d-c86e-4c0d-b15c-aa7deaf3af8d [Sclerotinia trifoliorum]